MFPQQNSRVRFPLSPDLAGLRLLATLTVSSLQPSLAYISVDEDTPNLVPVFMEILGYLPAPG